MNAGNPATRVLLVDDDARTARRLAQMLVEDGYSVAVAADAEDALCRLETAAPDVLVTDLVLPRVSGEVVAARARALNPGLKVIFITGYPDLCHDAPGAEPPLVFAKPVAYAELEAALSRAAAH
jgi:DNA-binding NtrC family response regulator